MELNDFQTKDKPLKVSDYDSVVNSGPTINERTASQIAAVTSIFTGGSSDVYYEEKRKILDPELRSKFIREQTDIRDRLWEDAKKSLPSLLLDDTIVDQDKTEVLKSLTPSKITVQKLPPLSSLKTLAEEAVIADNGVNETEQSANSRNSSISSLESVQNRKRQLTSMINALELDEASLGEKTVDFAEFLTPWAEYIHYKNLLGEVSSDKQAILLGNAKRQLYKEIEKIRPEDRLIFAEKIITLIEQNEQIVLPDGNDVAALTDLRNMLIDGEYTEFERYADNLTSILDVIGLGGLVKLGVKPLVKAGTKSTSKTPRKLTLEEEAIDFTQKRKEEEANLSKLEEEAKSFKGEVEPDVSKVFPKKKPRKKQTEADLKAEAEKFVSETEPTVDTVFREAMTEKVRTDVLPTSPSQTVKDYNPELARELHKVVKEDTSGEAAKALYGSSTTEALAKDLLPEPGVVKSMPNKVEMRQPEYKEPEVIRQARLKQGNTIVSEKELGKIKEKLIHGFENIEGMVLHPSSLLVRSNLDGTLGFTARYSPLDSGFSTAEEAIQKAKFAFRTYGLQETNFTILARKGDRWEETTLPEIKADAKLKADKKKLVGLDTIDYSIGMKYDYRFSPEDLTEVDLLTTAPGLISRSVQLLDALPTQFLARTGQGSLVQHLLDPSSIIHPQIVNSAAVAVDKAFHIKKLFVDEFNKFAKDYSELQKPRRLLVSDYIHQANLEGLSLNPVDLYARGFTEKEVEILRKWRQANDIMYYALNDDLVLSLRSKGIQAFVHEASKTKLYGKPISKNSVSISEDIFDVNNDSLIRLSKEELDELYEKNGSLFVLTEPTKLNGKWIDHFIVRNTPTEGYLRKIYDGEMVLAYRDGYYPVVYDANYFITKKITKKGGQTSQKVVASAKTKKDVSQALDFLRKSEPDAEFSFRLERSMTDNGDTIFDEGAWSVSANSGLTSQRIRGERLADAGVDLHKMGHAHLKDPLEAVTYQIQQLSQRTAMRPYLDALKRRWFLTYEKYLDLDINTKTGKTEIPNSISQVVGKSEAPLKMVLDARTNYNYISALENGYINAIDASYKAVLQASAQGFGKYNLSMLEKAFFVLGKGNPTVRAKTIAFKLFISMAPWRQAIIQRGQILLLNAINPKYSTTNLLPDLWGIDAVRAGFSKNPKYLELLKEVEDSGILEAVDANTLIRQDLLKLADLSFGQKTMSNINKPIKFMQKIGFDSAEQDVLLSSWLAHRDLAIKAGKNIKEQRVKDEILGQARAFTGTMNRAGEMPYSQNTLSLVAQFFSFRHKMLLQGITNRSLTPKDRLKLLAYTTALYGLDTTLIGLAVRSILPEDEPSETKDAIRDGLLHTTLNAALTLASGEEQAIDWGDLAPVEAYGMGNFFIAALDTPLSEILTESPSGSLVFGQNPKITDMFKTTFKFFNVIDDYEDPELQTKFTDVIKTSFNMFSGFSSLFKARYALETKKKMSSTGRITDSDVTTIEAVAAAFGFQTETETGYRLAREDLLSGNSFTDDDVILWYKELKRHLSRKGDRVVDQDIMQRVLSEAFRVFNHDRPRAISVITKEIEKDAQNSDYLLLKGIMKEIGYMTEEDLWTVINKLPDGTVRDQLTEMINTRESLMNGGQ